VTPNPRSVSTEQPARSGSQPTGGRSLRKARPGKCPWCGQNHTPHFTNQIALAAEEAMGKPTIHASTMQTPMSQIEAPRRVVSPAGIESDEAVAGFDPHETGRSPSEAAPGSSLLFGPGLDPPDPLADHNALVAATSAVLKDARRRWDRAIYRTGLLAAKAAATPDAVPLIRGSSLFPEMEP
jgi:hypothetical protein